MLSKIQYEEKRLKALKCIEVYLSDDNIMQEQVSKITGIPQSSVDRYLKDEKFIIANYGSSYKEKMLEIQQKINKNKNNGVRKGGINFTH